MWLPKQINICFAEFIIAFFCPTSWVILKQLDPSPSRATDQKPIRLSLMGNWRKSLLRFVDNWKHWLRLESAHAVLCKWAKLCVKFNIPLFYRYFCNHLSNYAKTIICLRLVNIGEYSPILTYRREKLTWEKFFVKVGCHAVCVLHNDSLSPAPSYLFRFFKEQFVTNNTSIYSFLSHSCWWLICREKAPLWSRQKTDFASFSLKFFT